MINLSYRPCLDDLRPITSMNNGLHALDATAVRTSPPSSFMSGRVTGPITSATSSCRCPIPPQ